jgi:hypothetical protein
VDRSQLSDLAPTRAQLEAAATQFTALTEGVQLPLVIAAQKRLQAAEAALTRAAGGLPAWTRTGLDMIGVAVVAWVVAGLADRFGLSGGWIIAVVVVAAISLLWPLSQLLNLLGRRLDRRRTRPTVAETSRPAEIEEILALLNSARDGLAGVIRRRTVTHRFAESARTTAGFDWLLRIDHPLSLLIWADRQVCEVILSLTAYRPTRPNRPNRS